MVEREVAGAGSGVQVAKNMTYWSVLDLKQLKIGGNVVVVVIGGLFRMEWFCQCSGGG
jgi:hypothetical protein